jgi:hypothetical protein
MSIFKIKRLKPLEDLIYEANKIIGSSDSQETGQDEDSQLDQFDALLDQFLDRAIKPEDFKDIEVKRGKELVERYLEYCKIRLAKLSEKIKELIAKGGDSQPEVRALHTKMFSIAKKISMLEDIYAGLRVREDAEIKQIADSILSKVAEIQKQLADEYIEIINGIGEQNRQLLQTLTSSRDQSEKEQLTNSVVTLWQAADEVSKNLPEEQQESLNQVKEKTLDKVSTEIGQDKLDEILGKASFSREETDLIARIVKLNYMTFTTEQEIQAELSDIRAKINSLKGQTRLRKPSDPETIRYMIDMVDKAELIILARLRDKSLALNKAKGIHFDLNIKLKLYERTPIPVTGKQIADDSTIMKLRKGLTSMLGLLLGTGSTPMTPAGQAWANLGKRIHTVYAKTLNTAAKATGKLIKGREGEMKADALSRLFIPGPSELDKKTERSVYEDSVAPGGAFQTPASIGGMGNPVAPTQTTLGSGDDFSPKKKKNRKRVLEFNDFIEQFLK